MPFIMKNVVPWGRNLDEYRKMFSLSETELKSHIAGFGDGLASFNAECGRLGGQVTSFDPIYQFSATQLEKVIDEAKRRLVAQTAGNDTTANAETVRDINELEQRHKETVESFLDDFEAGKRQGRYINHEMPFKIPFPDNTFDLGLSSHFLLLYPALGFNFHRQSFEEMLRTCQEIRIFPTVDSGGRRSAPIEKVLDRFAGHYDLTVQKASCHFMNGLHDMLVIRKKDKTAACLLH